MNFESNSTIEMSTLNKGIHPFVRDRVKYNKLK